MLTRRNGIYYFRKVIPEKLRPLLGRREFLISLKTRDKTLALLKAHSAAVECQIRIDVAKSRGLLPVNDFDSTNFTKKTLIRTETKPDGTVISTSEKVVDPQTIKALHDAGVSADQIALYVREFLEVSGHPVATDKSTLDNLQQMRSEISVSDYVKRFTIEREAARGEPLSIHMKTQLRRLIEILSDDFKLSEITTINAAKVRDALVLIPKNSRALAGLKVFDVIEAAKSKNPEYGKINATSLKRHFETYILLFNQAIEDKLYFQNNPFKNIDVIVGKDAKRREKKRKEEASKIPYSNDDLSLIFGSKLYSEYGSDALDEGIKFWMPLIGFFTGTRMSQITSLYCEDITIDKESGIPIIDFNDTTIDRRAKTDASYRKVPIHPLLLKLGLIEYAEKVKSYNVPSNFGGGPRLFPELRTYSRGSYSKRVEEWYNRDFLLNIGIRLIGDQKSFHAFRATLLQLLKRTGADELTRNCIIGWSVNEEKANPVVREHYETVTLQERLDALKSIKLLSHFDKIPPFPVDRELNFSRKYRNQWKQKL
jgi:hypothetical protein